MIEVYHGSFMEIRKPDISFSRQTLDFGKGFYVTPLREQAVRWALRWQRRGKKAIVNTYVFDDSSCALAGVRVKDFPEYDSSWLRFIMENRSGQASESYLAAFHYGEPERTSIGILRHHSWWGC